MLHLIVEISTTGQFYVHYSFHMDFDVSCIGNVIQFVKYDLMGQVELPRPIDFISIIIRTSHL